MRKKLFVSIFLLFVMMITIFSMYNNKVLAETRNGWVQKDGKWYYFNNNSRYISGKHSINEKYYWFNEKGEMYNTTGWYKDESYQSSYEQWYWINTNGDCAIGWKQIGGKWYYFDSNGIMLEDTARLINGNIYVFNNSGAMVEATGWYKLKTPYDTVYYYLEGGGSNNKAVTGWKKIGNVWYYLSEYSGEMYDKPSVIRDAKGVYRVYCFDKSGKWIENKNGWYDISYDYEDTTYQIWYYFEKGYGVQNDWRKIGNIWYYFGENGIMYDRPLMVKNKIEYFETSGAWKEGFKNGWIKLLIDGKERWYYYKNGKFLTGWQLINNVWYYFYDYDGQMCQNSSCSIGNAQYYFDDSGAMVTDYWRKVESSYMENGETYEYNYWEYYNKDGIKENFTGWKKIDDSWYYYENNNYFYRDGVYQIGKNYYVFGKDGKMLSNGWHGIKRNVWNNNKQIYEDTIIYYYLTSSGEALTNQWITDNGKNYCLNLYGEMLCNSVYTFYDSENSNEYYNYAFDKNGAMITNKLYKYEVFSYDEFGDLTNTYTEYYYFGSDGKAYKNRWSDDKKCYFDYNGYMVRDNIIDITDENGNSCRYAFDENGNVIKNDWFEYTYSKWDSDKQEYVMVSEWIYLGSDGKAYKNRFSDDGVYYFDENCWMVANSVGFTGEEWFAFDKDGHKVTNVGPFKFEEWKIDLNEYITRYAYVDNSDGELRCNYWFIDEDGYKYYLDSSGISCERCVTLCNQGNGEEYGYYIFDAYNHKVEDGIYYGWYLDNYYWNLNLNKYEPRWTYLHGKGQVCINEWVGIGNGIYYFDNTGHMVTGTYEIDGKTYEFGEDGKFIREV